VQSNVVLGEQIGFYLEVKMKKFKNPKFLMVVTVLLAVVPYYLISGLGM
jgi:hypothetical protein